jgi:hypothetical protein
MSRCSAVQLRQGKTGQNPLHTLYFDWLKRKFAKDQFLDVEPYGPTGDEGGFGARYYEARRAEVEGEIAVRRFLIDFAGRF